MNIRATKASSEARASLDLNDSDNANQLISWLHLIRDRRWSVRQKRAILDAVADPAIVYKLSVSELVKLVPGKWQSKAAQIDQHAIAADQAWLLEPNHHLLVFGSEAYPQALTSLEDPPIGLFIRGDLAHLNGPAVALVGSRKPTPAGKRMAEKIAEDLARLGIAVVSGLALGIDGAAHSGALRSGGPTISVMGCGLDTIYPPRHRQLFSDVCEHGCAISEYPLGVPVSRFTFPQRNRLVSGLSLGVVVVEAAERSGTLITARLATEQNRSVMVVPGSPLSRQYAGSHHLLQQGAALVTSAEDVLQELHLPLQTALHEKAGANVPNLARAPHHSLLDYLFHESTAVDDIISTSGLTAAEVSSMLLMLEVENAVVLADDGGYIKLVE